MEIAIVILVVALISALLREKAYKIALKTLADYYRKKGYPMPTDEELRESSHKTISQMFKLKEK